RSRGNPFLPAVAGQKFLPPGSLALSRFSRRATVGACENRSAAPAAPSLLRPLDALGAAAPWGQNLAPNRALAAKRLAHSQRQISLYVSRPYAHVVRSVLFYSGRPAYVSGLFRGSHPVDPVVRHRAAHGGGVGVVQHLGVARHVGLHLLAGDADDVARGQGGLGNGGFGHHALLLAEGGGAVQVGAGGLCAG